MSDEKLHECNGPWDYRIRRLTDVLKNTESDKTQEILAERILELDRGDAYLIPERVKEKEKSDLESAVSWLLDRIKLKPGDYTDKKVHDFRTNVLRDWDYWRMDKNL